MLVETDRTTNQARTFGFEPLCDPFSNLAYLYLLIPPKLFYARLTHSMCKKLCFEWRHHTFSGENSL